VSLSLHNAAYAGNYELVAGSENAATTTVRATAAPTAGVTYESASSTTASSGATYVWKANLAGPDAPDSRRTQHSLRCSTGALSASAPKGAARAKVEFTGANTYQWSYKEEMDGMQSGETALVQVLDIAPEEKAIYPTYKPEEDKWYLYLRTSFYVGAYSQVTGTEIPAPTASTGESTIATVEKTVKPFPQ